MGKLKDFEESQKDFVKRISRFANVNITEVKDEPLTHVKSTKDEEIVKSAEGERLLAKCSGYIIVCDILGKQLTSEKLAQKISEITHTNSTITFIIGGSLGLSEEVLRKGDFCLSVSSLTFTHSLFRIILLEQILRSFKIINNESYHK